MEGAFRSADPIRLFDKPSAQGSMQPSNTMNSQTYPSSSNMKSSNMNKVKREFMKAIREPKAVEEAKEPFDDTREDKPLPDRPSKGRSKFKEGGMGKARMRTSDGSLFEKDVHRRRASSYGEDELNLVTEGHRREVDQLIREKESLTKKLDSMQRMHKDLSMELDDMQRMHKSLTNDLASIERMRDGGELERTKIYQQEIQVLKENHEREKSDLYHQIECIKEDYTSITNARRYDHDSAVAKMRDEFQKAMEHLKISHLAERKELDEWHQTAMANLKAEHKTLALGLEAKIVALREKSLGERKEMENQMRIEYENSENKVRHLVERDRITMDNLKAEFQDRELSFEDEIATLRETSLKERNAIESQMTEQTRIYKMEHERKEVEVENDIRQLDEHHQVMISELKAKFENREIGLEAEIAALREKSLEERKEMENQMTEQTRIHGIEHERRETKVKKDIRQLEIQYRAEVQELKEQTRAEINIIRSDAQVERTQLEAKFAAETEYLRKDIDAYSSALINRDGFKCMSDHGIKVKFLSLLADVKELGRYKWRADQTLWTPEDLDRFVHDTNQRLFREAALREKIWFYLHQYVFCTPFRIFGDAGRELEDQWNLAFGEDPKLDNGCYTWPQATIEAERWRYVNVKECRDALIDSVSIYDPRAKLKEGYMSSLDAIMTDFQMNFVQLVEQEDEAMKLVEKIVKKASNMWLQFGMQRCRIVVGIEGNKLGPAEERLRGLKGGETLDLLAKPNLKRFGNPKGFELHKEVVIDGCEEVVEKVILSS